jgi:hypothetical protein
MMPQHAALPLDSVVPRERAPSAWTAWVIFSGSMMIVLGVFNAVDGLVALLNSDWYIATEKALLMFDFTTWGWSLLIFGTVAVLAGFGVLAGQTWARVVGVVVALLNAVAHLAFISAYPAWGLLIIALDVVVIYALTTHGADLAQPGGQLRSSRRQVERPDAGQSKAEGHEAWQR